MAVLLKIYIFCLIYLSADTITTTAIIIIIIIRAVAIEVDRALSKGTAGHFFVGELTHFSIVRYGLFHHQMKSFVIFEVLSLEDTRRLI